jgi:hypothetical protein
MCRRALDPPRFVDDSLEHPREGVALERAARLLAVRPHMPKHFGFPVRLIHLEAEPVLQPADLEGAVRPLVQQLDEALVELIDPPPQIVDIHDK